MTKSNGPSAGGKARAILQRQKSVDDYYVSPNVCKYCDKIIEVGNQKVSVIRKKKFCNQSCGAKYNNQGRIQNPLGMNGRPKPEGGQLYIDSDGRKRIMYLCTNCNNLVHKKGRKCQPCYFDSIRSDGSNLKKGDMYRTSIGSHSRNVMKDKLDKCYICGYDVHVQVCHIKPVSEFSDDTTLDIINAPSNLIVLCPNHHWELDHGYLKL